MKARVTQEKGLMAEEGEEGQQAALGQSCPGEQWGQHVEDPPQLTALESRGAAPAPAPAPGSLAGHNRQMLQEAL